MLCVDLEKPTKSIVIVSIANMNGVLIEIYGDGIDVEPLEIDRVTIERDKVVIETKNRTLVASERKPYSCTLDDVIVKLRYELADLIRRLLSI